MHFKLKTVDLGSADENGDPITSDIVQQCGPKLGETEEVVYTWIKEYNDKTFKDIHAGCLNPDTGKQYDSSQLWGILERLIKKSKIARTEKKPQRYYADPVR